MDFYYADVDENGVLCVDQLDKSAIQNWDEESVSFLADENPQVIYFGVDNRFPETRVPSAVMNPNLARAFKCYRRPSRKHMMRLLRMKPLVTYRCEACHYIFHPGE